MNQTTLAAIKMPDYSQLIQSGQVAQAIAHIDFNRFQLPPVVLNQFKMPTINFDVLELATHDRNLPRAEPSLLADLRDGAWRSIDEIRGEVRAIHKEILVVADRIEARLDTSPHVGASRWVPRPYELLFGLMTFWSGRDEIAQGAAGVGKAIGRMVEYLTYFSYHRP